MGLRQKIETELAFSGLELRLLMDEWGKSQKDSSVFYTPV